MTHYVAGMIETPTRTKHLHAARSTRPLRTAHERRVFINAPLEEVLHHTGNTVLGERQPGVGDPRFRQQIHEMGREIDVAYTLYEVPGGTQISALIQPSGPTTIHPLRAVRVEAAHREVAAQLKQIKDALE